MPIIKSTLRIIVSVAAILISTFFAGRMLYPYFRENDLVLYNNTQSTIQLCELREHESTCSELPPHSDKKVSIKHARIFTINKDYFFKLNRETLSELQPSEIYCEKQVRCLYALQLESDNLIYGLTRGQTFPATEFTKQPDGFPLEVCAFGYNNYKQRDCRTLRAHQPLL